jgi:predicted SAM-dependent methyltransferase
LAESAPSGGRLRFGSSVASDYVHKWLSERPESAVWDVTFRVAGAVHWARRGHVVRQRAAARYFEVEPEPKLQIGAGNLPLAGWLNSDLVTSDIYLDVTRPLPFPDSSFAYVFSEHVIEHISQQAGFRLLREIHRILRPGGVVRITTPDLKKIIEIYENRNEHVTLQEYAQYLSESTWPHERACQVLNTFVRHWGHKFIYDEEDLAAKLAAAGFERVERCEIGRSRHEILTGVDRHHTRAAAWVNDAEAMALEATRPPVRG